MVAMLSPIAGRKMFVGPDGRRFGCYVPTVLSALRLSNAGGSLSCFNVTRIA